jgi:hypothetical protein
MAVCTVRFSYELRHAACGEPLERERERERELEFSSGHAACGGSLVYLRRGMPRFSEGYVLSSMCLELTRGCVEAA